MKCPFCGADWLAVTKRSYGDYYCWACESTFDENTESPQQLGERLATEYANELRVILAEYLAEVDQNKNLDPAS